MGARHEKEAADTATSEKRSVRSTSIDGLTGCTRLARTHTDEARATPRRRTQLERYHASSRPLCFTHLCRFISIPVGASSSDMCTLSTSAIHSVGFQERFQVLGGDSPVLVRLTTSGFTDHLHRFRKRHFVAHQ